MAKNKERKIPEVLIWSDINNYPDDLASMVILAYLSDKKLINIRGLITELGVYEVRRRRAMYAKGAMSHLGYPFVRAVPGGDYDVLDENLENHYVENELTPIFEKAGLTINRSGTIFLQEYMKTVKEKNVFLLFNAPFTDFAKYLKVTTEAVLKKVKKIVIMGNVLPSKDERGYYQPDLESFNFKYCQDGAKFLFEFIQDNNVRTTIVPSSAVKNLEMDYSFLDAVKKSKNPVVQQLLLTKDETNPTTMAYDMISAMCLVDGVFKSGGGAIEKEDGCEKNISFAKIIDSQMMRDKICEIFKEKLEPKKISLEHLSRKKPEEKEEKTND